MEGKLVSAAVLAAGVVIVTGAYGSTGPAQVRITDVQTFYRYVAAPGGGRVGASEIVKQALYNASISARPIGHADLICTYLDARARSCTGSYFLPKGTLVVAGAIQSRLFYELPIVGGTRLFDNARGTLTVTSTGLRPRRREVLLFRLTG